ncbi:hypothetical protein ACIGNX_01090 [Actinosynnema sp. NPDC053489]|uniref:hypothetical protein n=1 Tax=Actinosynnema sp. NPDC053489 TaxID=3363916 RepID=UPI0037C7A4B4
MRGPATSTGRGPPRCLITVARPGVRLYLKAADIGGAIAFTSDNRTVVRAECTLDGVLGWEVADGVRGGATWSRGPAPDPLTCQTEPRPSLLEATSAHGVLAGNAEKGIALWQVDPGAAVNVPCPVGGRLDGPQEDRYPRDFAGVVPEPCG